jgi:cytochrome c oxidase cbb3-type subunit 4
VALLIFIGLFIAVIAYVFWPGNRKKFKQAAQLPLEDKNDEPEEGGDRS